MTKNRLSFAGSQTLLPSEIEFNSTGNFTSTETVGDARRLPRPMFKSSHNFFDDLLLKWKHIYPFLSVRYLMSIIGTFFNNLIAVTFK